MVIQQQYLRQRGYFLWDELKRLAVALGFQGDLFSINVPKELTRNDDAGLKIEVLLEAIQKHSCLNKAVDKTVNIHPQCWNVAVIVKCINLLDLKLVSFDDIRCARVSYQFYEGFDGRGLSITEATLRNAVKMCGRMVSPLKLMHRIKHMLATLVDTERLQLDEFFDLLLWCEPYDTSVATDPALPGGGYDKDEHGYYAMVDFDELFEHVDQRVARTLDAHYRIEERDFKRKQKRQSLGAVRSVSLGSDPTVDWKTRVEQVSRAKRDHVALKDAIRQSHDLVNRAKMGFFRDRSSAVGIDHLADSEGRQNDGNLSVRSTLSSSSLKSLSSMSRSITSDELPSRRGRPHTTACVDRKTNRMVTFSSAPKLRASRIVLTGSQAVASTRWNKTPPIVSEADRKSASESVQSAKFDLVTLNSKYEQIKERSLSRLRSGKRKPVTDRSTVTSAHLADNQHVNTPDLLRID